MELYRWLAEAARRNDSLLCVGLDPDSNSVGVECAHRHGSSQSIVTDEQIYQINR